MAANWGIIWVEASSARYGLSVLAVGGGGATGGAAGNSAGCGNPASEAAGVSSRKCSHIRMVRKSLSVPPVAISSRVLRASAFGSKGEAEQARATSRSGLEGTCVRRGLAPERQGEGEGAVLAYGWAETPRTTSLWPSSVFRSCFVCRSAMRAPSVQAWVSSGLGQRRAKGGPEAGSSEQRGT